ncbi:VWA domain-containing protein [Cellulosimicrobium cellulans]|uniref:DUF7927 domain-containing protein n=1 Tax=Cellulosimicrobium cellulans TaxID=1710 RepID=UPI0019638CF8|nr:VWA domain-containing protein [Cellulosimicrobium cellulans]MBN0039096.1 VWA domain-containing protein [Cellulosimicrobium cellulans]
MAAARAHGTVVALVLLVLLAWVAAPGAGPRAEAAVPDPAVNQAVVSVRAGGDRTGVNTVAGLPGVVLQLFRGAGGVAPVTQEWGTCTSDAEGDCSFVVPDAQRGPTGTCAGGGENCGVRFFVRQVGVPPGWYPNDSLSTTLSGSAQATRYEFQTPAVYADQVVTSGSPGGTSTFMVSQSQTRNASSGVWQQSRANPPLPGRCGLDVALLLDLSGSVGANLPDLKASADTFVDALTGTPSRMSLFTFSRVSPADGSANYPGHFPISTTADAEAFKALYAGWGVGGGTNWDRGVAAVAEASETYDLTVVITDGNPTYYGDPNQGNGSNTRFRELENGIFSANALKAEGTRVLSVGVGSGVASDQAALNLASLSGTEEFTGGNAETADFYRTGFAEAGAALRELVFAKCAPSLSVVKAIVPPGGTLDDAAPAGPGWTFTADSTPDIGGLPGTQTTTDDGTGAVNFPLEDFPGETTVTVTEAQQPGHTVVPVAGSNAVCTLRTADQPEGVALEVSNTGDAESPGFSFPMSSGSAVSCVIYNQAPAPRASLSVSKTWVVNGVELENGEQPPGLSAELWLDPPDTEGVRPPTTAGWAPSPPRVFNEGDTVGLAETVDVGSLDLCTLDSATVTAINGQPVGDDFPAAPRDPGDPGAPPAVSAFYDVTLTAPETTVAVTNTLTCPTLLTLSKAVLGGATSPGAWTLTATGPDGTAPGVISGATGTPAVTEVEVTPDVPYEITEAGGPPWYVQNDLRGDSSQYPGSTGSAYCRTVSADGTVFDAVVDGLTGGVVPPLGQHTSCEIVNRTAQLALRKVVENGDGSPAPPSAWSLTATPVGDDLPADLEPVTVPGTSSPLGLRFFVRPGTVYELSENAAPDAPDGYALAGIQCGAGPTPRAVATVTVDPLAGIICTFRNVAEPSTWTVEKSSDPEPGSRVTPGSTITYTLSATDLGGGAERPHDLVVVDDLSGVLAHATLVEASVEASAGTAALDGTTLTWTVPLLDPSATLTYQVVVDDDATDVTLTNAVTADGAEACADSAPDCRTTTHVVPPHPQPPGPGDPAEPSQPGAPPADAAAPADGLPLTGAGLGGAVLAALALVGVGTLVRAVRGRATPVPRPDGHRASP